MANEADETALAAYIEAISKAQRMNRQAIREEAAADLGTIRVLEMHLTGLNLARTA